VELDAQLFEPRAGGKDVLSTSAATQCNHRFVLQEQQRVSYLSANAGVEQSLLERVGFGIPDAAEPMGDEMSLRSGSNSEPLR
jgi:hypothetical protein